MTDDAAPPPAPPPPAERRRRGWTGPAALAVSLAALGLAAWPYVAPDAFGSWTVHRYMVSHPEVLQEASAALQQREEQGRVASINQVAATNPSLLAVDARDPAFGPTDARVTVVEFFDFRCPGCKAVAHDYRALMAANPDVRFVFKDWPILDRGEDVTSQYAARAALAAHQQGKYLAVYDALMNERALSVEAIDRILQANGVDLPRTKAAIASPEMTRHIADIHTAAAALGLQGTPTFFINGKASAGIDPREVGQLIQAAKR